VQRGKYLLEWLNYEKLPLMTLLSHGMFTGHVWLHGKRDVGNKWCFMGNWKYSV